MTAEWRGEAAVPGSAIRQASKPAAAADGAHCDGPHSKGRGRLWIQCAAAAPATRGPCSPALGILLRLLTGSSLEAHADGALVLGHVMPFWYVGSLILTAGLAAAVAADALVAVSVVMSLTLVAAAIRPKRPQSRRGAE
jgi:hypothetical protein